jgi:curved DNA-binding protein CbpA
MGMQRVPDPYRELGLQRAATEVQIKAAHRRLAKRYHPDAPEGNTIRFLAIQEAYLLLSDPLKRRDWDARHAPGPVRAADSAKRPPRPRQGAADGRWTREDTVPGGARPKAPAAGTKRPTARPGTSEPPQREPGAEAGDAAWSASGRDPSTRTYRWSASNVPWWEDFTPKGQPGAGAGAPGGAKAEGATSGTAAASGTAAKGGTTAKGGSAPRAGAQPSSAPNAKADASTEPAPTAGTPAAGKSEQGPRQGVADFDVYNRSSGAAWSSAARRYFRKASADLPSRGTFVYQGTQVVTGAKARQASDELLKRRPGVAPSDRQAFEPRPGDGPPAARRTSRPEATSPDRSTETPGAGGPPTAGGTASGAAWRFADEQPVPEPGQRRGATSLAAPAAVGGAAAFIVTLPLLVLGSFVLDPPLQPFYAAILLLVAALTGAVAASVWARLRADA